tara:strand:+ start:614 stop:754 length:141 start_codon:yes stop_codon:yes gene_type:complete
MNIDKAMIEIFLEKRSSSNDLITKKQRDVESSESNLITKIPSVGIR